MPGEFLIEADGVRKTFPGVVALAGVSCGVRRGEVLAVVGENGAGKSTLMKIFAGVYRPDAGELRLDGEVVSFANPAAAARGGVSLIHQELSLAENLSILDNLFLGRERTRGGPFGWVNVREQAALGRGVLGRVGLADSLLSTQVSTLPPGQKQLVEIVRALLTNARLIIMDEPTSSLTQTETDRLYEVIDTLRAAGVSVLYISHRLAEIRRCADRAIVLRDGKLTGELAKADITHANLVRYMVGRDLTQYFPRTHRKTAGEPVLRVRALAFAGGRSEPATFDVKAGEVFGMAGLVGAGRTELAEAVYGVRPRAAGTVEVAGVGPIRGIAGAIAAGVFLVPEDRRQHGLTIDATVGFNLSLPNLNRMRRFGWVDGRREAALHADAIAKLRVKTPSAKQGVGVLSGGNQQKVVFGKWTARGPKVLILDEPTRGVDVGAKAEIYALIDELAGAGVAVWMITSDLEELLGMSDRVAVMHEGRLAGVLGRGELSEEAVMRLATGGGLP